ncbi:MAG: Sfum_1244 family protein [Desulfobaccales bacterium]
MSRRPSGRIPAIPTDDFPEPRPGMTRESAPAMLPPTFLKRLASNCEVAAAAQAGGYSLCGALLRLRQLYKWQHLLPPWREPEPAAVLEWIEAREQAWDTLQGAAWQSLPLGRRRFQPLAVAAINRRLMPLGFAYGAGLSRGQTPTCFLGELQEVRRYGDLTILLLGRELARDLDGAPALRQGPWIYVRRQAWEYYLWDRLSDPVQQHKPFLQVALGAYGLELASLLRDPAAQWPGFEGFLAGELEPVIRHEVGEALEPSLGPAFAALLEMAPHSRLELWLRTLKDALAEVNEWGRLAHLIEERRLASLALLLALRPPLYAPLMPELEPAFQRLRDSGDWGPLAAAREQILGRLRGVAGDLRDLLDRRESAPDGWLQAEIGRRHLAPLGL